MILKVLNRFSLKSRLSSLSQTDLSNRPSRFPAPPEEPEPELEPPRGLPSLYTTTSLSSRSSVGALTPPPPSPPSLPLELTALSLSEPSQNHKPSSSYSRFIEMLDVDWTYTSDVDDDASESEEPMIPGHRKRPRPRPIPLKSADIPPSFTSFLRSLPTPTSGRPSHPPGNHTPSTLLWDSPTPPAPLTRSASLLPPPLPPKPEPVSFSSSRVLADLTPRDGAGKEKAMLHRHKPEPVGFSSSRVLADLTPRDGAGKERTALHRHPAKRLSRQNRPVPLTTS